MEPSLTKQNTEIRMSNLSPVTGALSSQSLGVMKAKSSDIPSNEREPLLPNKDHSIVNPGEARKIRWSGVSCYRKKTLWSWLRGRDKSLILNDVYGEVAMGELVAIVGPSGAGKSTLVTGCLTRGRQYAGWCKQGKISTSQQGSLNARILHQQELLHLHLNLTVRETLRWAAKIKTNGKKGFDLDKDVNDMLARFKLNSGDLPNRQVTSISGGQRKRLAVALELMGEDPLDLYVLDEPTSGLDPKTRKEVIQYLHNRAQAENNKTAIIITIHAPGMDLMEYFSKIIILTNYGQVMFHDSPNKISDAKQFAFDNGYVYDSDIVRAQKAIDLDILTSVADPENEDEMKICKLLVEQYQSTHEADIRLAQLQDEDRTEFGLLGYGPRRPFSFVPSSSAHGKTE